MKKYDVVTMGEALIDFVPKEDSISGTYKATVGGAPFNVAVSVSKLVGKVAMIARVGRDPLGDYVESALEKAGVDCSFVQHDNEKLTPVTIVLPKTTDMMRYIIYRNNGSDSVLDFNEIPSELFSNMHIFHIGILLMASGISAETTRKAVAAAKNGNALVSMDVNLRPGVWKSKEEMIEASWELIPCADIIKMTQEEAKELNFNPKVEAQKNKIILITDGQNDAYLYHNDLVIAEPVPQVEVVDVTGAGDSFMAAFLYAYLVFIKKGNGITKDQLEKCLKVAVYAGSLTVQKYGACESYPSKDQLNLL